MRRTAGCPWLLLVMLTLLSGCTSGNIDVAFEARHPDPSKVADALTRDRDTLADYSPTKEATRLRDAFFRFNLTAVFSKDAPGAVEKTLQEMRMASRSCLEADGRQELHKLSLALLERFEKELKQLIAHSATPGAPTALLSGAPPPAQIAKPFKSFAEAGGNFLLHAANAGLVQQSPQGGIQLSPQSEFFVRLAFKVRWANVVPEVTQPLSWLLSPFERKWYDIWVVERSRTASLQRKLQALNRLQQQQPDYPVHAAHGIIYFQARQYDQAVSAFQKAIEAHPGDQRTKSFLDEARRRLH